MQEEMSHALNTLEYLRDDIDQLAAVALDCTHSDCLPLDPAVAACLNLAWYFAEVAAREANRSSCGHLKHHAGCQTCQQFAALCVVAARVRPALLEAAPTAMGPGRETRRPGEVTKTA